MHPLDENLINIALAVALVGKFGVLGLGLAYAIAYVLAAVLALRVLSNKVRGFRIKPIAEASWRMLVAGVLMAEAIWLVTRLFGGDQGAGAFARLIGGSVVGAIVYVSVLLALRAPELDKLRGMSSRRRD